MTINFHLKVKVKSEHKSSQCPKKTSSYSITLSSNPDPSLSMNLIQSLSLDFCPSLVLRFSLWSSVTVPHLRTILQTSSPPIGTCEPAFRPNHDIQQQTGKTIMSSCIKRQAWMARHAYMAISCRRAINLSLLWQIDSADPAVVLRLRPELFFT